MLIACILKFEKYLSTLNSAFAARGNFITSLNLFGTFFFREYGLLNNNDGSPIQGVRYTADSNINPSLIYEALLKFLSL